jgi:hypothetical protein
LAALPRSAQYNPTGDKWTATGALHAPRRRHSATLLANGKVLVAGGTSAATQFPPPALGTAELFTATGGGTWAPTGPLHTPRFGHSAVRRADGTVLVAGGTGVRSGQSTGALRSVELYHPDKETWEEVAPMNDARTGHVAVVLDNGQVLVIGGAVPVSRTDEAALAYCELFDGEKWTPTGSMLVPRAGHQAVLLDAGTVVLVTGGRPPGPGGDGTFDPGARSTAELYHRSTGVWTDAQPMPAGRAGHRAVALADGRVLVVGGTDGLADAGFASAAIYDPTKDNWTVVGGLATGRADFAAAALPDGRVLVTGGVVRSGPAAAGPDPVEVTAVTEVFAP